MVGGGTGKAFGLPVAPALTLHLATGPPAPDTRVAPTRHVQTRASFSVQRYSLIVHCSSTPPTHVALLPHLPPRQAPHGHPHRRRLVAPLHLPPLDRRRLRLAAHQPGPHRPAHRNRHRHPPRGLPHPTALDPLQPLA